MRVCLSYGEGGVRAVQVCVCVCKEGRKKVKVLLKSISFVDISI